MSQIFTTHHSGIGMGDSRMDFIPCNMKMVSMFMVFESLASVGYNICGIMVWSRSRYMGKFDWSICMHRHLMSNLLSLGWFVNFYTLI
jgi:hypothetical protein